MKRAEIFEVYPCGREVTSIENTSDTLMIDIAMRVVRCYDQDNGVQLALLSQKHLQKKKTLHILLISNVFRMELSNLAFYLI